MPHTRTCSRGHTWDALSNDETSADYGCPYCAASADFPPVPDLPTAADAVPVPGVLRNQPSEPRGLPTVPGYELMEEIGRGGMGVVYKACQLGLNRLVALKMIRAGARAVAAERARFRAAAE